MQEENEVFIGLKFQSSSWWSSLFSSSAWVILTEEWLRNEEWLEVSRRYPPTSITLNVHFVSTQPCLSSESWCLRLVPRAGYQALLHQSQQRAAEHTFHVVDWVETISNNRSSMPNMKILPTQKRVKKLKFIKDEIRTCHHIELGLVLREVSRYDAVCIWHRTKVHWVGGYQPVIICSKFSVLPAKTVSKDKPGNK